MTKLNREALEGVVRELHAEGLNDAEIARKSGLARTTVIRARERLELPRNGIRRHYGTVKRRQCVEAALEGLSVSQIQARLDIANPASVTRILHDEGLEYVPGHWARITDAATEKE